LAGTARVRMGVFDEAERLLAESLARFRAVGAEKASMLARNALGICFSNQGRYDEARVHYEAFLSLARQAAYTRGTANALNNLGSNYARAGDYTRALDLYRESYELALQTGEQLIIAVGLSNLGSVSRALAQYDDARDFYARSLAITRNIGERRWTAANLNGLGLALADEGDDAAAANVLREGLEAALEISSTPDALDAIATLAKLASRHAQTDLARDMLCLVAYHPVAMSSVRARARRVLEDLRGTADDTSAEPPRDEDAVYAMAERARAFCDLFPGPPIT
jgi:tetratricopeptide (TPR) repeat protein